MMKHYIIDGNNLIGKLKDLHLLQKRDGQAARERLVFMIDNCFFNKKVKVTLCFDGYSQIAIRTSHIKIYYSENRTADEIIKNLIEHSRNRKLITMVSSDHNLIQFARVCQCEVYKCEEFAREITAKKTVNDEDEKKKTISDEEMKRLFGI